jgi:hypothetical protein
MRLQTKLAATVLCLWFLAAIPAKADFIGGDVTVNYEWPNLGTVLYAGGTKPIPPGGTTFDLDRCGAMVDVTSSDIVVTFPIGWFFNTTTPKTFDGVVVADPSAEITGVSLNSTNISGYVASDLGFDAHDVFINFPYPPFSSLDAGASVTVGVDFDPAATVPEPGSFTLLALALAGLGFCWWKRASKALAVK